ncbi:hypothetical protein QFC22_000225 [Naganishia vaughanmartiniae]|uniref:Uncharacterized protein n=1 Tax=Naganishia vaughanmartiniae TaxID=1424756 RepID=A0ACC2XNS1_9TREE|nr:hypothetical protein QFC22_000225 [Naganishia vaughanmartiniae]
MMDDYVFLEQGKRKVEQWGKEIVGLKMASTAVQTGSAGQGVPSSSSSSSSGKTAALQHALREKGILVDFLPEGMERRRKNQSHYNPKYAPHRHLALQPIPDVQYVLHRTKHLQISMELRYPSPPPSPLTTESSPSSTSNTAVHPGTTSIPSYQMQNIPLNDTNTATTTLYRLYTNQARKIPAHYPVTKENTNSNTNDNDNEPTTTTTTTTTGGSADDELVFAMKVYHPSGLALSLPPSPPPPAAPFDHPPSRATPPAAPPPCQPSYYYTPFPPLAPLSTAIKGTSFIEYPTIDVFLRKHWDQQVQRGQIVVLQPAGATQDAEKKKKEGQMTTTMSERKRKNPDDDDDDDEDALEQDHKSTPRGGSTLGPVINQKSNASTPAPAEIAMEPAGDAKSSVVVVATSLLALDYGSESE